MYYSKIPTDDGQFLIVNGLNQVIQTHRATPFRPLSWQTADLLCHDLNEIHEKNVVKEQNTKKDAAEVYNAESWSHELAESFGYCLLSTMIENVVHNHFSKPELDLNHDIQWDMLYRITPQPPGFQDQHALVSSLKPLLSSDWADLSMNWSSSLQEMEEDEVDFVSENIILELQSITDAFTWTECSITKLLLNFTEGFSITAVVFWVSNKIDSAIFNDLFRVFYGEEALDSDTKQSKFRSSFFIARLEYLRKINASIAIHDKSFIDRLEG